MNCSLAQTLNIIGERWTLLILREAFFGVKKFSRFHENLDIARNVLTHRLSSLVQHGILDRVQSTPNGHAEYQLTQKGLDLQPILIAMNHWGDKYVPHPRGKRLEFVERETGKPIRRTAIWSQDGNALNAKDITAVPGPGLGSEQHVASRKEH